MKNSAYILFTLALVFLAGCWGSGHAKSEASKKDAFREVIGFEPPASVTEIRSSYYHMRDSYIRWLSFKCDLATLSRIERDVGFLASTGGHPRWAPGFSDRSQNPNAPDWWSHLDRKIEFLELEREVGKDHVSDRAHVWIDPKTGTVFATRDVID